MLCVQDDAERRALRYHAERGNDQLVLSGRSRVWKQMQQHKAEGLIASLLLILPSTH
jgi:hypothetical protein